MGNARNTSSISLVLQALKENKIRYIIAGMSAAFIQGAPATTLDTDIWEYWKYAVS
ncbi:MAG: hypothetical protein SGI98_13190 [Verrucomicrobiota bacterium]|nr:hypothetical protein [Verrucomicrobiota bacterium]